MLLDVNVLLALAWPNHQFHAAARRWLRRRKGPWHTCAVTQLGFIRLSSNPAFTSEAVSAVEATALLLGMTRHRDHAYLEALPSPADQDGVWPLVGGHRLITDAYLACVARRHDTRLATFDGRLSRNPALERWVERIDVDA